MNFEILGVLSGVSDRYRQFHPRNYLSYMGRWRKLKGGCNSQPRQADYTSLDTNSTFLVGCICYYFLLLLFNNGIVVRLSLEYIDETNHRGTQRFCTRYDSKPCPPVIDGEKLVGYQSFSRRASIKIRFINTDGELRKCSCDHCRKTTNNK
ncbi:MAG: hypothetical protein F6K41_14380 [Symploca sp. SIO3E6]|nr:hypothetical protein [Caldora sp. SIO3E6]